jgi:hypothetical protein
MFYLPGRNQEDRHVFENLTTNLSAELLDANGQVLCTAKGAPVSKASERWVLNSSFNHAAYWHDGCRSVSLSRADYQLRVTVGAIDPRSPEIEIQVLLEGGGFDSL